MSIKLCTMVLSFSVWCYKVSLKGMNTNFALQIMVWCFHIQKCISSGNRSDKTILSLKCFHVMFGTFCTTKLQWCHYRRRILTIETRREKISTLSIMDYGLLIIQLRQVWFVERDLRSMTILVIDCFLPVFLYFPVTCVSFS